MFKCTACGDRIRYNKAWGHHSVPFGYGDTWCSLKCCKTNKLNKKLDKRQNRKWRRVLKKFQFNA